MTSREATDTFLKQKECLKSVDFSNFFSEKISRKYLATFTKD